MPVTITREDTLENKVTVIEPVYEEQNIFNEYGSDNFTIVANELIRNPNLSAKAKGILIYLLSRPNDWQVYETEIATHFDEGVTSIRSGLKELETKGYMVRQQVREGGRFGKNEWKVYSSPEHKKALQSNTSTVLRFPEYGKPVHGKPVYGKPDTTNTDSTKTERKNTKYICSFDSFYEKYPNKVGRKKAQHIYERICTSKEKEDLLRESLSKYINKWSVEKTERQYIPHPSTWLNQERWEDEVVIDYKKRNIEFSRENERRWEQTKRSEKTDYDPLVDNGQGGFVKMSEITKSFST
jgi:hypothetical protein